MNDPRAIQAKKAARKARRAERVAENAALAGEAVLQSPQNRPKSARGGVRTPVRRSGQRPPARKRSRKALVRSADTSFSLWIRARDPYSVFSGKPSECCFHIVTRSKYAVRWDPDNAVGSTMGENYEMELNPHKFIAALIAKRGLPWYEALVRRSNETRKFSRDDLAAIAASFALPASGAAPSYTSIGTGQSSISSTESTGGQKA